MSISLSDGTTTIELPSDLQWTDEFAWSAVEQSQKYSITGALIVQQGVKAAGRPITLSSNGAAWVTRATVEAIQAFYDAPGQAFTLTIAGTAYPFQFQRPDGFRAQEVRRLARAVQSDDHRFTIEIRGFEVAE